MEDVRMGIVQVIEFQGGSFPIEPSKTQFAQFLYDFHLLVLSLNTRAVSRWLKKRISPRLTSLAHTLTTNWTRSYEHTVGYDQKEGMGGGEGSTGGALHVVKWDPISVVRHENISLHPFQNLLSIMKYFGHYWRGRGSCISINGTYPWSTLCTERNIFEILLN